LFAVENDLGGLENLSLIPGTVGASPIQNIGAYGVEIKDVFHRLNPVISKKIFSQLFQQYPKLPHYPQSDGTVKLPAGWLIEQCGWKGKRVGDTGTHARQALVLVNHGNAKGAEIHALALKIQESVRQNFKISLEMEVNIWD